MLTKTKICLASFLICNYALAATPTPSPQARKAARHAELRYREDVVESMAQMVRFNTVADPNIPFERNQEHLGFKRYIRTKASALGLDYQDFGYVLVVGMGSGSERLGLVTHGDVQPVNPSKWKKSPFELDRTSEPGHLIGRGTEDDKGPIAAALYAMKAVKDEKVRLSKRIELYIYMSEESDWEKLEQFLKTHVPPQTNITLDSQYPVVTAEKGFGTVRVTVPRVDAMPQYDISAITSFTGGFFGSQIPEDAAATISHATPELEAQLRKREARQAKMQYRHAWEGDSLRITALGVSAHSSVPENGVNAISMLADLLSVQAWPDTTEGKVVNFLNDMFGTRLYGESFGSIAYRDEFMGPMSFVPTVITSSSNGIEVKINVRRPRGKEDIQLRNEIAAALDAWQTKHGKLSDVSVDLQAPWIQTDVPHVPALLGIFSHFTGIADPKPVSIGGGTNSRYFPRAVSFGPAMPGAVYTGHSEHEFISSKQLMLNLKMYTAAIVELGR